MSGQAESHDTERELPSLPAVDVSRQAWAYAFGAFALEMLLWGPMATTGVFLKYYATLPEFASAPETQLSLIGTLPLLFSYGMGLPLLYAYNRYPRSLRTSMIFGIALFTVSTIAASFVNSVGLLILLQGILPGFAAEVATMPLIRWIPEWFDKRMGTAGGIIFAGGGIGGVWMPLLTQALLDKLGFRWALRISALYTAVLSCGAFFLVKPRVPIARTSQVRRAPMPPLGKTYLRAGFIGCAAGTLLQAFGYFNVGLFIPRFSDTLDASTGAGLLAAFNFSTVVAQVVWGYLSDRMQPALAMAFSSVMGAVFVLTVWGIGGGVGTAAIAPFAVGFAIFTGGYTSMWSRHAHSLAGPDKEQQTLLFAGFSVARGVGAAIGPIAGAALYRMSSSTAGPLRWGSAGSPGFVALVAVSLAASAAVSLAFAHWSAVAKAVERVRAAMAPKRDEVHAMTAGAVASR